MPAFTPGARHSPEGNCVMVHGSDLSRPVQVNHTAGLWKLVLERFKDTARRAGTLARIGAAAREVARAPEAEKETARRALAALLADARGVPMKVGQFLAGGEDSGAFAPLVTGVEPLPLEQIRPALETALGQPLEHVFTTFDPTGIAASLGQVHRATLHDGNAVAVKVRYPNIVGAVNAELRLAQLVPELGPVRTWGFDLAGYKRVLYDDMQAELDYRGELLRQKGFRDRMNVGGLVVPRVYPDLSSESVLVQTWEGGNRIQEIACWPADQRRHAAVILMCTLFQSLFYHGEIHGDPHEGNYRYRMTHRGLPEVVLLDFGCTITIGKTARLALLKLMLGAMEDGDSDPLACFAAMGFDPEKLLHIQPILPALCKVLFEPFLAQTPFALRHWGLGKRVDSLLGELKWWFRSAGPANLLLLLRAFHGLVLQLETLQVNLPWQAILYRVVDADLCQQARNLPLPPVAGAPATSFQSLARFLKVRVMEGHRQVVAVTFPASQAAVLEEIVPEETRSRIAAAGIDLLAIKSRACASGLGPQELFEFDQGGRNYRVWLE